MSEQPETYSEDIDDKAYDAEQAADAEVNLDQPGSTDDVPWSPPEQAPIASQFDDDPAEETIDQRIAQEVPEEGTAYGAPDEDFIESADLPEGQTPDSDMVGGDDPDAIPVEDDFQA